MNKKKRVRVRAGDWVELAPVTSRRIYCFVARYSAPFVLGYFFEATDARPFDDWRLSFTPKTAIFLCKFGDLHVIEGKWPVVAHEERVDRKRWVLPKFGNQDYISGKWSAVTYCEETLEAIDIRPCRRSVGESLPWDGLYGAEAVEIVVENRKEGLKRGSR